MSDLQFVTLLMVICAVGRDCARDKPMRIFYAVGGGLFAAGAIIELIK